MKVELTDEQAERLRNILLDERSSCVTSREYAWSDAEESIANKDIEAVDELLDLLVDK